MCTRNHAAWILFGGRCNGSCWWRGCLHWWVWQDAARRQVGNFLSNQNLIVLLALNIFCRQFIELSDAGVFWRKGCDLKKIADIHPWRKFHWWEGFVGVEWLSMKQWSSRQSQLLKPVLPLFWILGHLCWQLQTLHQAVMMILRCDPYPPICSWSRVKTIRVNSCCALFH